MEELTTEQKIEIVLDKIRPFIRRDGGDVEFVSFKMVSFTLKCKVHALIA